MTLAGSRLKAMLNEHLNSCFLGESRDMTVPKPPKSPYMRGRRGKNNSRVKTGE
jgi:hypothetical protein